jgi:hemerythrin superfamily protein
MAIKRNGGIMSMTGSARSVVERVKSWVDDKTSLSGDIGPDAVRMLEEQHMMVRKLFGQIMKAENARDRGKLFDELLTSIAVHTEMEEKVFYVAMKRKDTTDLLLESTEEHLAVKRLLADLIDMSPSDERFMAKITVLREMVEHHAREEEKSLFPRALVVMSAEFRAALAQEMTAAAVDLLEGREDDVRSSVLDHIDEASPI